MKKYAFGADIGGIMSSINDYVPEKLIYKPPNKGLFSCTLQIFFNSVWL